jgi:hypothetical protein
MSGLKALVMQHLANTFEEEAWQPPLSAAVAGVTAAQAMWKREPERHSIWQIVQHVTRWKRATHQGWLGRAVDLAAVQREDWGQVAGDDAAWRRDVRALHEAAQDLKTWAAGLPEDALARPAADDDAPLAVRLMQMATHDAYHAGQIRYLRALQGS